MTIKIGVDIGHGSNTYPPSKGFSKGGVDYHEHNHNSLLGKEVKRLLEVNGFDVFMAQKPNKPEVSLQQRGRMYAAENCDLVISLHANWNNNRNVNGRCGFYWHSNSKTKKLVQDIVSNMKDMGYELHGNGMHASERGSWTNLYITRALPMDSILIEHGFMNGTKDFDYVFGSKQDKHIKDMAIADVKAICKFFGKSFKEGGKVSKPKPSNPQTGSSSSATAPSSGGRLTVDGSWGPATTRELQRHFKTIVDGVISGQPKNRSTQNIPSAKYGTTGSNLIRAMQRHYKSGIVDGKISGTSNLIKAMQRKYGTIVDGYVSNPSNLVKEIQRRLNAGTL